MKYPGEKESGADRPFSCKLGNGRATRKNDSRNGIVDHLGHTGVLGGYLSDDRENGRIRPCRRRSSRGQNLLSLPRRCILRSTGNQFLHSDVRDLALCSQPERALPDWRSSDLHRFMGPSSGSEHLEHIERAKRLQWAGRPESSPVNPSVGPAAHDPLAYCFPSCLCRVAFLYSLTRRRKWRRSRRETPHAICFCVCVHACRLGDGGRAGEPAQEPGV